MKIKVTNSTIIKPMTATPITSLWLSNMDAIMPSDYHALTQYFYRFNRADNFFDAAVLKAALSRALVEFYPVAGRLKRDDNGRIEIDCNAEGVLFLEADADGEMDDLGDFGPKPELGLVPTVDYSQGIATYPLCLVQITRFQCGGVCLGIANEHHVADGLSALHFINTWSDIARGLDKITLSPFIDRTVLRARSPPNPMLTHTEYQPFPQMSNNRQSNSDTNSKKKFSFLKQTRDQINALKAKCNNYGGEGEKKTTYSTYEVLAGHVWRCISIVRGLPEDQETKLYISVDGRSRMKHPSLPQGYFGNVIFSAMPVATCGELRSNPLIFAVGKIHDALARMDDMYLRSALDYLETLPCRLSDLSPVRVSLGAYRFKCPNLGIVSWVKLPFYEADFGWGKPVFAGPGELMSDGKCYVMQSPENEGEIMYAISLPEEQMKLFEELLCDV